MGFAYDIATEHAFVVLSASIPFEIAWYFDKSKRYVKITFSFTSSKLGNQLYIFPLSLRPDLQIICCFRTYEIQSLLRCCCIFQN
jgi:hypothetical protein